MTGPEVPEPGAPGPNPPPEGPAAGAGPMVRRRLARIEADALRVESPFPEGDRALRAEIREIGLRLAPFRRGGGWPRSLPAPGPEEVPGWLDGGVAALRAGLHREAWGLLHGAGEVLSASGGPPEEAAVPLLRLAGEWMRWTGRAGPVTDLEPLLRRCADLVRSGAGRGTGGGSGGPPGASLRLLADGVEAMGRSAWSEELRAAAREGARTREGGALRLPTAGIGVTPAPSPGSSRLRRWIEDLLGVVPDASFGRLRLAPELPRKWEHASVDGIRTADARVRFLYRREGPIRTFTVRQEEGRMPLDAVFEPLLPAPPRRILVGGRPAEPTLREEARGVRVSLQFPLDPQREVRIDAADDA